MQVTAARLRHNTHNFVLVSVKWNAIINQQTVNEVIYQLQDTFGARIYLYNVHNGMQHCRGEQIGICQWVVNLNPRDIPWETWTLY